MNPIIEYGSICLPVAEHMLGLTSTPNAGPIIETLRQLANIEHHLECAITNITTEEAVESLKTCLRRIRLDADTNMQCCGLFDAYDQARSRWYAHLDPSWTDKMIENVLHDIVVEALDEKSVPVGFQPTAMLSAAPPAKRQRLTTESAPPPLE